MLDLGDLFGFSTTTDRTEWQKTCTKSKTLIETDTLSFSPIELAEAVQCAANEIKAQFRADLREDSSISTKQQALAVVLPEGAASTITFLAVTAVSMVACPLPTGLSVDAYKAAFERLQCTLLITSQGDNLAAEEAADALGIQSAFFKWFDNNLENNLDAHKSSSLGDGASAATVGKTASIIAGSLSSIMAPAPSLPFGFIGDGSRLAMRPVIGSMARTRPHAIDPALVLAPKEFELACRTETAGAHLSKPKIVQLTHRNLVLSLANTQKTLKLHGYDMSSFFDLFGFQDALPVGRLASTSSPRLLAVSSFTRLSLSASASFSRLPHSPSLSRLPENESPARLSLPEVSPHFLGQQRRGSAASASFSSEVDRTLSLLDARGVNPVHRLLGSVLVGLMAQSSVYVGLTFDADTFWDIVERLAITWVTLTPAMLRQLLTHAREGRVLASSVRPLRFIRVTLGLLHPSEAQEAETLFSTKVLNVYALTEASHQVCSNRLFHSVPGSCGPPLGVEVSILRSSQPSVTNAESQLGAGVDKTELGSLESGSLELGSLQHMRLTSPTSSLEGSRRGSATASSPSQRQASMIRRASVSRDLERGDLHSSSPVWHFQACSLGEPGEIWIRGHSVAEAGNVLSELAHTIENAEQNPNPNARFEGRGDSSSGLRLANTDNTNDTDDAESTGESTAAGSPASMTGEGNSEKSTTPSAPSSLKSSQKTSQPEALPTQSSSNQTRPEPPLYIRHNEIDWNIPAPKRPAFFSTALDLSLTVPCLELTPEEDLEVGVEASLENGTENDTENGTDKDVDSLGPKPLTDSAAELRAELTAEVGGPSWSPRRRSSLLAGLPQRRRSSAAASAEVSNCWEAQRVDLVDPELMSSPDLSPELTRFLTRQQNEMRKASVSYAEDTSANVAPTGSTLSHLAKYLSTDFPSNSSPDYSPLSLQSLWFRTGDVGVMERGDGILKILGRNEDVIHHAGVDGTTMISPFEIEECCLKFGGGDCITEAKAFGMPHPSLGEVVHVAIVLKGTAVMDEKLKEELHLHARQNLVASKVPEEVHQVDALPEDPHGFVDLQALRQLVQERMEERMRKTEVKEGEAKDVEAHVTTLGKVSAC